MNFKDRLNKKIKEARKLTEEFKKDGVNAELDEKTGEITVRFSDIRNLTEKEEVACEKGLASISEPTGINLFEK